MNPITFNERMIAAISTADTELLEDINQTLGDHWRTAPLFEHRATYTQEDNVLKEVLAEGEAIYAPFRVFRLACHVTGKETAQRLRAVVRADGLGIGVLVVIDKMLWKQKTLRLNSQFWIVVHSAKTTTDPNGAMGWRAGWDNKWLLDSETGRLSPDAEAWADGANIMLRSVLGFICSAMLPSTHIATVSPARDHKSVEWVKARTHYTLITHGHPANSITVKHGDRVTVSEEKEMHRMAHNRRAHFKTLKHERYRFARGKTIFVRAAWVGPKEWKDEGGKQIYRILEEVK